jgi:pilus assembly protein CpaF
VVGDRSQGGVGAVTVDAAGLLEDELLDVLTGFGPLQPYLDDVTVEEVWVNDPGRVFVARGGRSELTPTVLAPGEVEHLVERMLAWSGRRVDRSAPFVDAQLPDGSRLHVVIPDVTRRHWAVNIRKFVAPVTHLDDLVRLGTLTEPAARFLAAAVASGLSIVVAGATQAGKTTLLGTLLNALPASVRLVTCEEVFELHPLLPDVVAMQTRQPNLEGQGEIRLRRLVVEALRMRPGCLVG